jgi:surface protein
MFKENQYIYTFFLIENVKPLDWINLDGYLFKKWLNKQDSSNNPYILGNYNITKFIEDIDQLTWINNDSFNFIKWINGSDGYNPPTIYNNDYDYKGIFKFRLLKNEWNNLPKPSIENNFRLPIVNNDNCFLNLNESQITTKNTNNNYIEITFNFMFKDNEESIDGLRFFGGKIDYSSISSLEILDFDNIPLSRNDGDNDYPIGLQFYDMSIILPNNSIPIILENTSFDYTFSYTIKSTKNSNYGNIDNWEIKNVNSCIGTFSNNEDFNTKISSWDTSNVTNLQQMFQDCENFNQQLKDWDTSNVTDMDYMFENCKNFNNDISKWCVSKINTKPIYFDKNTSSDWSYLHKPFWGECPNKDREDVEVLYSELLEVNTVNSTNLSSSDNWEYYNPSKDPNIYFALMNKTNNQYDKLEVLKINKLDNTVVKCTSTTNVNNIYWNSGSVSNRLWLDIKVIYTDKGDYAYMCTEGSGFDKTGNDDSAFNNKVVHIYKLDTLYENETYSCVNTIPGINYHNVFTFQSYDKSVAYLYGVGSNRNALEIYDLSINPEKPFFLGGYLAYPDGYNHTHTNDDPITNRNILYIHDIDVSDQIPGHTDKILLFGACIYWTSLIVLDVTDPVNIQSLVSIVDPRFQNPTFDNYGLHHCWLTPNSEFLITGTEGFTKDNFIIDIKSLLAQPNYYYNNENIDLSQYSKYVGDLQILSNSLGTNLHNQYCYQIKNDDENFMLFTAAYASGTMIHILNYNKIREGLLNIGVNNNLQDSIVGYQRVTESYESTYVTDNFLQEAVWSVSYCPNSKICFDSCYFGSNDHARGYRVFKVNSVPEIGHRTIPPQQSQVTTYTKKVILSKDPLFEIHPGFYRLIIRNANSGYYYEIFVNDTFKGISYGNYDLGRLTNDTNDTIEYSIKVVEYNQYNIKTNWEENQYINVDPHTYMSMNEYTQYNLNMFNMMHPPLTLVNSNIDFDYNWVEWPGDYEGFKLTLDMLGESKGLFSFETLSLYDDPGWRNNDNSTNNQLIRCHSHYYVYEDIEGTDSQGTSYNGYNWVKKGRLFKENWIIKNTINNKWVKIRLSTNSHGTLSNSDNTKCQIVFSVGTPVPSTEPNPDPVLP